MKVGISGEDVLMYYAVCFAVYAMPALDAIGKVKLTCIAQLRMVKFMTPQDHPRGEEGILPSYFGHDIAMTLGTLS